MDMQNVAKLDIPEGEVRTIHDKDGNLIWGKVSYGVKYKGDTAQNGTPTPDAPVAVQTVTGEQTITINSTDYEVNLGKNLFDKDNAAQILDDIYINTTASKLDNNGGAGTGTIFVNCLPNTEYTVSKILSSRFILGTTTQLPANGVAVSGILIKNNETSATITTGSDAKYLCIYYRRSVSDTVTKQQLLDSIQIERGSTATQYASYFTPIELCKIGDYQDYIYKSGDTWKIHKAINKTTLTGSLYWGSDANGRYYTNNISDYAGSNNIPFSSHFVGYTNVAGMGNVPANAVAFNQNNATPRFYIGNYGIWANSDALKTWLNSNLPTIYYALATPTDTEITNAALTVQLNAVEQFLTRYGYNATVTGNLPIIIDRTAL